MRKIILGTVLGLVFSIGAYTSAKAGNGFCEESDPCAVWEMIQPNGDIWRIVCNPSVCGSGIFDNKVVRLEATPTPRLEPWPTFIVPTYPPEQPTAAPPQLTSEPSAPSASQQPTGVEPTSGPQPSSEATQQPALTQQPAPEATPAPPVVGQPTPTSVPPVVVAPTQTSEPVVPIIVPIIVPTVDPNVIPNTYEWKLSDNNGEFRFQPKRRSPFSGEQQAI